MPGAHHALLDCAGAGGDAGRDPAGLRLRALCRQLGLAQPTLTQRARGWVLPFSDFEDGWKTARAAAPRPLLPRAAGGEGWCARHGSALWLALLLLAAADLLAMGLLWVHMRCGYMGLFCDGWAGGLPSDWDTQGLGAAWGYDIRDPRAQDVAVALLARAGPVLLAGGTPCLRGSRSRLLGLWLALPACLASAGFLAAKLAETHRASSPFPAPTGLQVAIVPDRDWRENLSSHGKSNWKLIHEVMTLVAGPADGGRPRALAGGGGDAAPGHPPRRPPPPRAQ
jgi:hypothetical protein